MYYILDDLGYIEDTSSHYIEKDEKVCTQYNGTIPEGYDSLDDWVLNANIRAYKIVSNNLTYDAARDAELQELFEKECRKSIITAVLSEDVSITGTTTTNDISLTEYCKLGTRLNLINGSVVIGANIKNVLVSGAVRITNNATSGSTAYNCYIYKNDEVVASSRMYGIGNAGSGACTTPLTLIPVTEGDVIKLAIWKVSSNKCTLNSTGNATILSVEEI